MNIQNNSYDLSFYGSKKSVLKELLECKKTLKENRLMEKQRGMLAGREAKLRGIDECKEIIIRETIAGNFDYLKGFNEAIGKDMAKKAYSAIRK